MADTSKTLFVTGSNGGIGRAVIKVFAEKNWNIVAHVRKHTDEFHLFITEIEKLYKVIITPVYFDMLDSEKMKECVKDLKKRKINIDALVNNAGVPHGGLFLMTPISDIKNIFDINLFSHMELTQYVLKLMPKESASIVNVASVAGIDAKAGNSAYGVSKAALILWTKVLQAELHGKIRVNAVAPGLTETEMVMEIEEELRITTLSRSVMNRLAKPEEVAGAIYFLSSDDASFITGQVLRVDGGGGYVD